MSLQRLRVEARDLLELFVLPGLVLVLPWALAKRSFRMLSRQDWLYRHEVQRAVQHARALGVPGAESREWAATRRFTTLMDHADFFLVRYRRLSWMREVFTVRGEWPEAGHAGLVCTFHWGCGAWSLPQMRAAGLQVHALVATLDAACFEGRSVLHAYAKARTAMVAQQLGRPTLDVSNNLRPVLSALQAGEQILAVLDVPADQVSASQVVNVLGLQMRVPTGMLRLAVKQRLPVTLFLAGQDPQGGRFMDIVRLEPHSDLDALLERLYAELDRVMRLNSAGWHFWSEAERFVTGDGWDNARSMN